MDETAFIHFVHYSSRIRLPDHQINHVEGKEEYITDYTFNNTQDYTFNVSRRF